MTNLPDSFGDDPVTERLACYFEELYAYLIEEGVPEDCLPSPWHVLRRVTQAIDHEKLKEWLDAYVAVEAQPEDSETDEDDLTEDDLDPEDLEDPRHKIGGPRTRYASKPGSSRPEVKRRPSYLRALDPDPQTPTGLPRDGLHTRGTEPAEDPKAPEAEPEGVSAPVSREDGSP